MAVNWYWKHKVGELVYRDMQHNQTWKLEMYGGNMMCAFIYRFKDEKGNKMYNFFCFFNDIEHARRCLKDDKDFLNNLAYGNHKLKKVRLCISSKEYKYSNKEMLQLAKLLADNGYKVEVY